MHIAALSTNPEVALKANKAVQTFRRVFNTSSYVSDELVNPCGLIQESEDTTYPLYICHTICRRPRFSALTLPRIQLA
jgi:hypothetical protein